MKIILLLGPYKNHKFQLMKWSFKSQNFYIMHECPKYLKKAVDENLLKPLRWDLSGYLIYYPFSKISIMLYQSLASISGVFLIDRCYSNLILTNTDTNTLEMTLKLKQPVIEDHNQSFTSIKKLSTRNFKSKVKHLKNLQAWGKWLSF